MSNKQLDKTLKVNNDIYDVNAVYSDEAGKTSNNLNIKNRINNTVVEVDTFNGSKDVDLSIVPTEGGEFSGTIKVPSHSSMKSIENKSVLNYEELLKLIGQLTGSPIFNWNDNKFTGKLDDDRLQRIGIVVGTDASVEEFAIANNRNRWLSFYLYITTEIYDSTSENPRLTGNIYYGSCDTDDYFNLSADAETAKIAMQLAKTQSIRVNLSTDTPAEFNGSENTVISPGVVGTLAIENGGTGAKDAQEACNKLIKNQEIAPGTIKINTPNNNKQDGNYGIDLNNSDIVGLNALYFADTTNSPNECINFVNKSDADESKTTYDRLYSQAGTLYYQPNKTTSDNITTGRYEVYHSGGASEPIPVKMGGTGKKTLSSVTVGHAETLTTYVCETHGSLSALNTKTRIIASKDAPDDAKDGIEGDIWIQYSTT